MQRFRDTRRSCFGGHLEFLAAVLTAILAAISAFFKNRLKKNHYYGNIFLRGLISVRFSIRNIRRFIFWRPFWNFGVHFVDLSHSFLNGFHIQCFRDTSHSISNFSNFWKYKNGFQFCVDVTTYFSFFQPQRHRFRDSRNFLNFGGHFRFWNCFFELLKWVCIIGLLG